MYICIDICIALYIHISLYIYMYMCIYICAYYVCMHVCTYIYPCIYVYRGLYTLTYLGAVVSIVGEVSCNASKGAQVGSTAFFLCFTWACKDLCGLSYRVRLRVGS